MKQGAGGRREQRMKRLAEPLPNGVSPVAVAFGSRFRRQAEPGVQGGGQPRAWFAKQASGGRRQPRSSREETKARAIHLQLRSLFETVPLDLKLGSCGMPAAL